jgi:DNA repair photolyase
MKLKVVQVPSIAEPITKSPGFAKKLLADYKLDLMGLCGFGCLYCSSNAGNYLRINRERFARLTEEQTGERTYPAADPALTFVWPDVLQRLEAQIDRKPVTWGAGKTLVVSMLTDAFSPPPLADGTTKRALLEVFKRTDFRVRILTKSAAVASPKWLEFFRAYRERVVVGLSIGTLDDEWARRVEIGTSSPSARVKALRALQDAGIPTFGMLCPVFPDVVDGGGVRQLIESIRPELCEHVWAEPYNDRLNWRAVAGGYELTSAARQWFVSVYGDGRKEIWSRYARALYQDLRLHLGDHARKLLYLLYEDQIDAADAKYLHGLDGILLQSKPGPDGKSRNPAVAALQNCREMPRVNPHG